MRKLIYLILLPLIAFLNLNAQTLDWASQFSSESGVSLNGMTTDAMGNIYTCGTFGGTADFDPGPGVFELTGGSFITKLDASGNLVWAKSLGSLGISTIGVDDAGNVYLGYNLNGTEDFDPGDGVLNFTANGFGDVIIVKLSASGDLVWAKQIGGPSSDNVYGMYIEGDGTIYLTGSFGETMDFDPGSGTVNMTVVGSKDIFVLKLTTTGDFIWVNGYGGSSFDYGNDILVDASGNIYVAGEFSGIVDFDPGAGTVNLTAEGSADIFLFKLDASGNYVWAGNFGGEAFTIPYSLTMDDNGNIFASGGFTGTADLDPGAGTSTLISQGDQDAYVSKISTSTGNLVWAKSFGGTGTTVPGEVAVDDQGNVFTAGSFSGVTDFDPGPDEINLEADVIFDFDIYISRLDSNGDYSCAVGIIASSSQYAYHILTTPSGDLIIGGIFESVVDFDPGPGVTELTALGDPFPLSDIESDVYVIQIEVDPCPIVSVEENTFDHDVSFFPNPTAGPATIELNKVYSHLDLRLTDLAGRLISSTVYQNTDVISLDINVPNGVYFVEVLNQNKRVVFKVVKH